MSFVCSKREVRESVRKHFEEERDDFAFQREREREREREKKAQSDALGVHREFVAAGARCRSRYLLVLTLAVPSYL